MRIDWSKAPVIVLGATFAVVGARAAAAQDFEGSVTYEIHTQKSPATMTVTSKGSKARMEMTSAQAPGGSMVILVDGAANTRTVMMPAMKKYMLLPPNTTPPSGNLPKFTATKTGQTETVAGETCQVIHVTTVRDNKTEEGDACVGKGVGFNSQIWQALAGGRGSPMDAQMQSLRDAIGPGNGLLKMTSIKDGKPEVDVVATKIERKSVSDDQFTPPSDYSAMQMPMRGGSPGATPQ